MFKHICSKVEFDIEAQTHAYFEKDHKNSYDV